MCGICGLVSHTGHNATVAAQQVRRMCATMVHRGPDDEGVHSDGYAAIGMRRLAIIDLHTGQQPVYNEDGSVAVVLNGEIYNFQQLRRELEAKGHVFASRSDTEVIVHLYEEMGEACVERLNGMFGFAIWDSARRTLILARDRIGVKPLYYYNGPEGLAFGSELKALLQVPSVPREIDLAAIDDYLCYLYVPGDRCVFRHIHKLPPATTLVFQPGVQPRLRRYWSLAPSPDDGLSEKQAVDELRGLLETCVRDRLTSDVPYGAFLSGGIDSSAVVGCMSRIMAEPVRTFTVGFPGLPGNELAHAERVAEHFRTNHMTLTVDLPQLPALMHTLAHHFDEPFADPSAAPTYLVSQTARRQVKMVLSGDGGDELFAGYTGFAYNAWVERARRLPVPLRAMLAAALHHVPGGQRPYRLLEQARRPLPERWCWSRAALKPEMRVSLYTTDLLSELDGRRPGQFTRSLFSQAAGLDPVAALQYVLVHDYLPDDVLVKVDRASMACSLEVRSPLLDYRLFEFAARLPSSLKLRGTTTKYVLKRALDGFLPPRIASRPKQGFTPPTHHWFRGELGRFARDVLLSHKAVSRGYFRRAAIERLLDDHADGTAQHGERLWALVMLELWHQLYILPQIEVQV